MSAVPDVTSMPLQDRAAQFANAPSEPFEQSQAPVPDVTLPLSAASTDALPISRIDFGQFAQDMLHGLRWLHKTHGPIAAIEDSGQRVVFLFSPEYNQQVLSDTETFHARFFTVRGPKRSSQRRCTCV